eukprot:TRINITY_DN227_c0_g1_i1.p1 TRINITY_DN227_c0_g1~~TRINITY_DN227_c0_g1_i1.p1  ORF type:complete len:531 (-),score=126.14 TRINITY_DN227_c0_g1_i1:246-1766(-)
MAPTEQCVVIVDPISTGANLAAEISTRGYELVRVWTSEITEDLRAHVPACAKDLKYYAEVLEGATLQDTVEVVRAATEGLELKACIVGGETGVTLADQLSEALGLRTNGSMLGARRNKSVQQKLVKAAGLRAVREAVGTSWAEVADFVASEGMPVVVKPVESAGSDGVELCYSAQEAQDHFNLLMTSQRKAGAQGASVIVQEFLKGKEYVVDHVSRDGIHKTVNMWVYDKRPCNGGSFVYYGMLPVPSDSEEAKVLIPYARGVLDALKIQHGPTHGEVMMTEDGPCLVEMNCRAHGGDGAFMPLAKALNGGYTQVSAAADSHLDAEAFAALPELPPSPFHAFGEEVDLVNMRGGVVTGTPGYDAIRKLRSFVSLEGEVEAGQQIAPTVDMFTMVGSAMLVHKDEKVLRQDVAAIREMETDMELFEFEEHHVPLGRVHVGRTRGFSELSRQCSEDNEAGRRSSFGCQSQLCGDAPARRTEPQSWSFARTAVVFSAGVLVGVLAARRR